MNAPAKVQREIPACLTKGEPDAVYGWFSTRRLLITKGDTDISLSADDLARLKRFFEAFDMEQRA